MAFGSLALEADGLLRKWVKESGLTEGNRLPSERDLAKLLGVGHYAVNRAMSTLITEGLVERQGYKLFFAGKKASGHERPSFHCDLVVSGSSVHKARYTKLARELEIPVRMHSWMSTEEAVSILQTLDNPQTDAVIFDAPHGQSASIWEPSLTHLGRQGIPVVCVGQPAEGAYSVVADTPRGVALVFQHLWQLGHRELAMSTVGPRAPLSVEVVGEWEAICRRHGAFKSAERIFLPLSWQVMPEDSEELAKRLAQEWNEVTALLIFTGVDFSIQHLLDKLSRLGKKVPQHLSITSVDDTPSLGTSTPPVTTATMDIPLMHETAFRLAQRAVRKKAAGGVLPRFYSLRLQPLLTVRQSTKALTLNESEPETVKSEVLEKSRSQITWVQFMSKIQDTDACLRRPYPQAMKSVESQFRQLDLAPFVNRPLNFRRGWLGDMPLRYLHPGRHWIHGVPFEVLGGSERTDCGAIVFHSAVNSTGMGQKLPSQLTIPIDAKVAAVYVLHGCANAKYLQPFATYSFYQKKKELGAIPMVSLGQPPPELDSHQLAEVCKQTNVQDWWPDFPHLDFTGARMAPIVDSDPKEHVQRHVYLYTLEWINPSPDKIVSHMEISADPKQSTTLGVLSICVLLAKEDAQKATAR